MGEVKERENTQKKGVIAPMSSAWVVMPMMWFWIRVISAKSTERLRMLGEFNNGKRFQNPLTSDPLGPRRDVYAEEFLDGQSEGLLVVHHGDVVEPVEVGQCLCVGLVLAELLRPSVQESHVREGFEHDLSTLLNHLTRAPQSITAQ